MGERYGLLWGIIISVIIHGFLLLIVQEIPGYLEEKHRVIEEYTEVELFERPAIISTLREQKPVVKTELLPKPAKPPEVSPPVVLQSRVKEMGQGLGLLEPDFQIKLPQREEKPELEEYYAKKLSEQMTQTIIEKMEQNPLPTGLIMEKEMPPRAIALEREELKIKPPETSPIMAVREPSTVKEEMRGESQPAALEPFRIKGPAGSRKVIQRPLKPPVVEVTLETEIVLQFWVLPNGEVGRAIPIKKGEPKLEAVALAYLKQWRFDPLPRDEPQLEQEGIIPIRFTIR